MPIPLPAEITEHACFPEILGYLNYSSGVADHAFLQRLNELWQAIQSKTANDDDVSSIVHQVLLQKLAKLTGRSVAFQNTEQAQNVLRIIFEEMLPAYRRHHRNLLFHQSDTDLWQPFFIGRVAEAVLTAGTPWSETTRIVEQSLARLNNFIGYRPVPILETNKHEPYDHERVALIPLYIAGAGVSAGNYQVLIEQTLTILQNTNPELLEAAGFSFSALGELAFDPRAYDFNHPVNRRPNYHFGTWDQQLIDNKGYYRRFVIQQCTLDAIRARVDQTHDLPREQVMLEAAAVLAGTILMACGTTGSGPEAYDSSVTLATLLPKIARYRDEFYQQLLAQVGGDHRQRLLAEAADRHQLFAGARQHLNAELARLRALQLLHVQLALIFSRLGYSDAATRQSQIVPAASARMICQMQCLLTNGRSAIDAQRLHDGFFALAQAENALHRAINCGAVIDPWNILGFGGQFSLFPAVENSIPDPRVEELLDLIEQIFALYAQLWHEFAIANDAASQKRLAAAFQKLAAWWDGFATAAVSGVQHISGSEAVTAAKRVAAALGAWHQAGEAAGQVAFWQPHVEHFNSPQAYGRVIEALLQREDLQAAVALLMHWLSQAEKVRLDASPYSFYALATQCLHKALAAAAVKTTNGQNQPGDKHLFAPSLGLKYFDYLEANAEHFWNVPQWHSEELPEDSSSGQQFESQSHPASRDFEEDADQQDNLLSAAYENMVYRDSTADGTDADMLEVPGANDNNDEFDRELRRLSPRLAFLAMLSAQWKMLAWFPTKKRLASNSEKSSTPDVQTATLVIRPEWLARAQENDQQLLKLATAIQRYPIAISSAAYDALLEYDRRRVTREMLLEKVVTTLASTMEAELFLAAAMPSSPKITEASKQIHVDAKLTPFIHGRETIALMSAIMTGDSVAARSAWRAFLIELAPQPSLYMPLSRGGAPTKIASARAQQQVLCELLHRLPRLGLLRESCQLLRVARAMEKSHSPGIGAVTEFNRLFEIGYQTIVESLVESSLTWGSAKTPQADSLSRSPDPSIAAFRTPTDSAAIDRAAIQSDSAVDAQLIDCLQQVTESLLSEWLSHSRTLRLSVLERVSPEKSWQELVNFIQRYGHDLFTQQFFHLGNLRAILHQGVDVWLDRLANSEEPAQPLLLLRELDHGLSRAEAKKHLALVIEAIVENYAEYCDYNATTTQSDRGELLFILLDFLRVKVDYERIHWNLRPVALAHEVLIRRSLIGAAELWRRAMVERTSDVADQQLARLAILQAKYGMRLATVADRLEERFIRPLVIDRIRALVQPAAEEARTGNSSGAFALLEQEAGELADEPCGAGLDLPGWLLLLKEEVDRVCNQLRDPILHEDQLFSLPWIRLSWDEIQSQLSNWDTLPEMSS
ncbi:MAG TPA: hypothetical protein VFE46_08125 [Pirellulales bacterium]|nr:hypothetical protein [Pirellulales bacterium]